MVEAVLAQMFFEYLLCAKAKFYLILEMKKTLGIFYSNVLYTYFTYLMRKYSKKSDSFKIKLCLVCLIIIC